MEWVSLVVAAIGAVGGCAGFYALHLQKQESERLEQERATRKRLDRLPEDLRPALREALAVATEVKDAPKNRDWTEENVKPLVARMKRMEPVLEAARVVRDLEISMLRLELSNLHMEAYAPHRGKAPDEVAASVQWQGESARKAIELSRHLLDAFDAGKL